MYPQEPAYDVLRRVEKIRAFLEKVDLLHAVHFGFFFRERGNPEVVSRPAAGIIHFEKRCRRSQVEKGWET